MLWTWHSGLTGSRERSHELSLQLIYVKSKYSSPMLKFDYVPIKDQDGVSEINLATLFKSYYSELPWLVESCNCIYLVTNLLNSKKYVGQASYFYGRFVINGLSHLNELRDPNNDLVFQRAIRKYKPKNFKVEVLEINCNDLNERESYWIKYFHSCILDSECNGYNMNYGGTDRSHLNTKEVKERIKSKYGGVLPINLPEARAKARLTISKLYNGDPYGNIHTPESYENCRKNHGGVLAVHTPESQKYASTSRILRKFRIVVNTLISENLELSFQNYRNHYYSPFWRHLYRMFNKLDIILEYEFSESEYKMLKSLYDYCIDKYPDWMKTILDHNPFE